MKIKLLPQARADIRLAVDFVRKEDPRAADNLIVAVQKSLRLIENNPNVGRFDPEDGTREWSIPNWPYLIPYRVKANEIEVLHLWHTRRNKPGSW